MERGEQRDVEWTAYPETTSCQGLPARYLTTARTPPTAPGAANPIVVKKFLRRTAAPCLEGKPSIAVLSKGGITTMI